MYGNDAQIVTLCSPNFCNEGVAERVKLPVRATMRFRAGIYLKGLERQLGWKKLLIGPVFKQAFV